MRQVHLGLGSFFRAHQAWYTDRSPDAAEWGIAAFGGRSATLAHALTAQDGLYTLTARAPGRDRSEVVASISRAHSAGDHDAWLGCFASPEVGLVTVTVTEAGYGHRAGGGLDRDLPALAADVHALRDDPASAVRTVPARLVAGLAARRRVDAGPIAVVPCDNLAANGTVTREVLSATAELVDPALAEWIAESVSVVTTMVDRITPRTTDADRAAVRSTSGWQDEAPVVTEPFSEWVLEGHFPCGRPAWHEAGAAFVADVVPFEQRKLRLLNGGHSLLAYLGSARGHLTVADAVADDVCRTWLEQWWSEAGRHLAQSRSEQSTYTAALLDRFSNVRMEHRLGQIAADGSQKLPVRVLPTLRAERSSGRLPSGAVCVVAAWVAHLRRTATGPDAGPGCRVDDVRREALGSLAVRPLVDAARGLLGVLDADLVDDRDLVAAVATAAEAIVRRGEP